MPAINATALDFLYLQFQMRFDTAYAQTTSYHEVYATEIPSATDTNVYGWLSQLSGLREWIGPRQIDSVASRAYSLRNKDWEKTIGLEKNRVEDDTWGVFNNVVDSLGVQSKLWPEDVMTTTLQAGDTELCYDGQYFFDTDHPIDPDDSAKGTYSNKLVGATYDLSADPLTAYNAATSAMSEVLGADGRPVNAVPNIIMVPPRLRRYALTVANALLTAQTVGTAAAAVTNVFQGDITVVVNPRLGNEPTVWYLLATNRGIKPLIFQNRQAPQLVKLDRPTDPKVFNDKLYIYGVDARGAGGYSLPFLAFRMAPA